MLPAKPASNCCLSSAEPHAFAGGLPFVWPARGGNPFAGPRAFAFNVGPGDGEARFDHAGVRLWTKMRVRTTTKDKALYQSHRTTCLPGAGLPWFVSGPFLRGVPLGGRIDAMSSQLDEGKCAKCGRDAKIMEMGTRRVRRALIVNVRTQPTIQSTKKLKR